MKKPNYQDFIVKDEMKYYSEETLINIVRQKLNEVNNQQREKVLSGKYIIKPYKSFTQYRENWDIYCKRNKNLNIDNQMNVTISSDLWVQYNPTSKVDLKNRLFRQMFLCGDVNQMTNLKLYLHSRVKGDDESTSHKTYSRYNKDEPCWVGIESFEEIYQRFSSRKSIVLTSDQIDNGFYGFINNESYKSMRPYEKDETDLQKILSEVV